MFFGGWRPKIITCNSVLYMSNHRKRRLELTTDTLIDISAGIIEHHEMRDAAIALNFIDHYRAYLQDYSDREAWKFPLVDFGSFITNQTLLNSASSCISVESGEQQLVAPIALKRKCYDAL